MILISNIIPIIKKFNFQKKCSIGCSNNKNNNISNFNNNLLFFGQNVSNDSEDNIKDPPTIICDKTISNWLQKYLENLDKREK